jgi:Dyp-type peroxidase family
MLTEVQEGIYYRRRPTIGNSFCMVSVRAQENCDATEVGNGLGRLWNILMELKKGITIDLDVDVKHRTHGNLTVLLAYGSKIFDLKGATKKRPADFGQARPFKPPDPRGGGTVIEGSEISYSDKINQNHLLSDHIIFQFIADNEFFTNRAVVELWKELHRAQKEARIPLYITGVYSGFQRADQRNWLGFHDGVSNLRSRERPYVILINSRYLTPSDTWLVNGTYLTFLRIAINMERWQDTAIHEQELIIGRHKMTGCPIIGVDINHKPVKNAQCPIRGTSEIIDPGNEYFRDHPPYGAQHYFRAITDKDLQYSHIGRTRPINQIPVWDRKSSRIYRQGFEFLETTSEFPGFKVGLNFVSFQNTPERFFRSFVYPRELARKTTGSTSLPNLEKFMSVSAAGIFLAPPILRGERFPGAQIFFNDTRFRYIVQKKLH